MTDLPHPENVASNTRIIGESLASDKDAFNNRVVQNTTNNADIAGHYPYSPERWHVFVNGTRQLIQYGAIPEFTDSVDTHDLTPQTSGDVVTLQTTEIFRYVVGYVLEWSGALETNQALQSGDSVAVGYGNADLENSSDDTPGPNADGWFLYWNSGHSENEVTIAQYRGGTEQDSHTVDMFRALSEWKRIEGRTNWYGVGRTRFAETYTTRETGGEPRQENEPIGTVAIDGEKGPERGNQRIFASVKADTGAGNLTLRMGSIALKTLGGTSSITRQKTHEFTFTPTVTGAWEPAHAIRLDPDRNYVNTQLTNTDIVSFADAEDVKATVQVFEASNVLDSNGDPLTDSNYAAPDSHNPTNSVIEISSDVAQVVDDTGTAQTSMSDPGGYQVGYSSWYTTGTGSKTNVASGSATRKRAIPPTDVAVVLTHATATSNEVIGEIITEQDW